MTRQIQIRRGTATENDAFTGAVGEVTMDTTNNTLRVHDGTTPGGTVLAKKSEIPSQQTLPDNYDFVIESQLPTAENNYTWYRKYKSGWVEMGGETSNISASTLISITLPIAYSGTNFSLYVSQIITDRTNNAWPYPATCIAGGVIIDKQTIKIGGRAVQSAEQSYYAWHTCGMTSI